MTDDTFILPMLGEAETNTPGQKIIGTKEDDILQAGDGDDTMYGMEGKDGLYAYKGNDLLIGGGEDDYLFGGPGDDTLEGGTGKDVLKGQKGADTFRFHISGNGDKIDFNPTEGDRVELTIANPVNFPKEEKIKNMTTLQEATGMLAGYSIAVDSAEAPESPVSATRQGNVLVVQSTATPSR